MTIKANRTIGSVTDDTKTVQLNWPWWLHPAVATLMLTGVTAATAITFGEDSFTTWGVQKYIQGEYALLLTIGIIAFLAGLIIPTLSVLRSGPSVIVLTSHQVVFLRTAYRFLFTLTILGYLFWAISAVLQGISLADLASVVDREEKAISELKASSRPIAGLTTLTQFGPLTAALGAFLFRAGLLKLSFLWVVPLALIRTLFYAERLALLEVLIPILIVVAVTTYRKNRWTWLLRLGPLIAAPFVWIVFASSEYFRSWVYYQTITTLSFPEWVTTRLLGYYVTGYNNSALMSMTSPGLEVPPYFSASLFWNAPGVDAFAPHPGIGGASPESWWVSILELYGNPEFNNTGSFLAVNGEIGTLGMILYWLVTGLVIGGVYVGLRRGSITASLAYSVFYIGILELPRFIYWTQGRAFPLLLAVIFIALGYPRARLGLTKRTQKNTATLGN
ncbi:O-antigen polymerase [Pseudarthrobacter sp. NPDC089323]